MARTDRGWKAAVAGLLVSGLLAGVPGAGVLAPGASAAEPGAPETATADMRGGCYYRVAVDGPAVDSLAVTFRCAADGELVMSGYRRLPVTFARDARPGPGGTMLAEPGRLTFTGSDGLVTGAYRFDMKALLDAVATPSVGERVGRSVVTSLSSFLLYPGGPDRPISVEFVTPGGVGVATAFRVAGGLHRLRAADVPLAGYMVFGRFTRHAIRLPGQPAPRPGRDAPPATLRVAVLDEAMAVSGAELRDWVRESAAAVGRYFGGFPVRRALLVVRPVPGARRVIRGTVMSGGGASVILMVGGKADREALAGDWILVHELIHTGSPYLKRAGRWLNEGIAVYVQTLVHVRAGWMPESVAWRGFMHQMPRGLPALAGDGLAGARGIGGVYWGGALFMLLADLDIRKKTGGRRTLADCLRGVLRAGGDSTAVWTVSRMLAACDRAAGTDTMARLAARHVAAGSPIHLGRLWRELGVSRTADGVTYDDAAPLAAFRQAIMRGPRGPSAKPPPGRAPD